jgi:hypothetical protein
VLWVWEHEDPSDVVQGIVGLLGPSPSLLALTFDETAVEQPCRSPPSRGCPRHLVLLRCSTVEAPSVKADRAGSEAHAPGLDLPGPRRPRSASRAEACRRPPMERRGRAISKG